MMKYSKPNQFSAPKKVVSGRSLIKFASATCYIFILMTKPPKISLGPPQTRQQEYEYPPKDADCGAPIWEAIFWDGHEIN